MNTLLQTFDKPGVTLHLLHIDVPHTLKTNKRNKRAAFTALREEVQDIALMKQSMLPLAYVSTTTFVLLYKQCYLKLLSQDVGAPTCTSM